MSYLAKERVESIRSKITNDKKELRKIYLSKSKKDHFLSISHNLVADYEMEGWSVEKVLSTKTKVRKAKAIGEMLEDDIWCQLHELGFEYLNTDNTLEMPFGRSGSESKQVDVLAIGHGVVLVIECKASESLRKKSFKNELDATAQYLEGYRKAIKQIFGDLKVKFVFATRNIHLLPNGADLKRLAGLRAHYHNDSSYKYVNSLIKNYKGAAIHQFMGLLFKGQSIDRNKVELPAIEGKMGGLTYYMFSIEPNTLLKMGFILHRTKANEEDMPTYQRLLVPSRLKGITSFIDDGGFFPNAIIVNFNMKARSRPFKSASSTGSTTSRYGTLSLPNSYSIAYIIDGQHRLYGYANSKYKKTNTIPVVAFMNLSSAKQLEMFMDINQNQKAVSPSLRLTLEEDLYWSSDKADARLKALRSSIIKRLSTKEGWVLYDKISIGEDSAELTFKPFVNSLKNCGLLPTAKGNKYQDKHLASCLYDTNNNQHDLEMEKSKLAVSELINGCYEFVEENYNEIFSRQKYFIVSNRGTYAFVSIIGSLNTYLTSSGAVDKVTSVTERLDQMSMYLDAVLIGIVEISPEKEDSLLSLTGAGADIKWYRYFQELVNNKYPGYKPDDFVVWQERNDASLQEKGGGHINFLEGSLKERVLIHLKSLFGENWEREITWIKTKCTTRALEEEERYHKEFGESKSFEWTEMFSILDYKEIVEKFWPNKNDDGKSFSGLFSVDIGLGFKSKSEKTRWISRLNTLRNQYAHRASKNTGLSKEEVSGLQRMKNKLQRSLGE